MEREIFAKLWDWSCFLDLVKESCKSDLKWCGVQILSVLLKLGYKATENLYIGAEEAFSCLLRLVMFTYFWPNVVLKYSACLITNLQLSIFSWEEFCQDTSLEKAGYYAKPIADYVSSSPDRTMDLNNENCLKSSGFNYLPVKLHESQLHLKRPRLTTRYKLFYLNLKC